MISKRLSIFDKDFPAWKALQKKAFPKEEQYPFWLLRLMAMQGGVEYLVFYDEDLFCGLAYTSSTREMMYILYLAVNDAIRSKGYGTQILNLLKEKDPSREVTLNVEPLDEQAENYAQRKRRMEFYHRNGFHDTGFRMVDITGEYAILSTSEHFSVDAYKKAISQIGMNFYKPKVVARGIRETL